MHVVHPQKTPNNTPELQTGHVKNLQGEMYSVQVGAVEKTAKRAAGCVLAPQPGDKVLLLCEDDSLLYILNVLENEHEESVLAFPGKVSIQAPELDLLGAQRVAMQGAEMELSGVRGRMSFLELGVEARDCEARVRNFRSLAKSVILQAAKCFRYFGEEHTRADRVKNQVRGRWSIHADDMDMIAKNDVKVDGKQILLG